MRPVYLDHNATTPIAADVLVAMDPYLKGQYGNPLTAHRFGDGPRGGIEAARQEVRALLGAQDGGFRVLFNSGASEGLNHAIKGLAFASLVNGAPGERRRIVLGGIEHYAVTEPVRWLSTRFGFETVVVPPAENGVVPSDALLDAVDDHTLLATLHWANNELGTVQPVEAVGRGCRERGVPFVCDAVQIAGKLDASSAASFADVVALSAHKLYGPKGAGALLVRDGIELAPLVHGAQQEGSERGGTHNVAGIVGLGAAAELARTGWRAEAERVTTLRDALAEAILSRIASAEWNGAAWNGAAWNGAGAQLLPNTLNVSFDGCPAHLLCEELDRRGFAISAGAACLSGEIKPSANLLALGLSRSRASTSVRISLGHDTSAHDVRAASDAFVEAVARVRAAV